MVLFLVTAIQLVATYTLNIQWTVLWWWSLQDVFHLDMTACQKKLFNFMDCESFGSHVSGLFKWNQLRILLDRVVNIIKSSPRRDQIKTSAVVHLHIEQSGRVLLAPLHHFGVDIILPKILDVCAFAFRHWWHHCQHNNSLVDSSEKFVLPSTESIPTCWWQVSYYYTCEEMRVRPSCVQHGTFTLWQTCFCPPKKLCKMLSFWIW
jgi:hypothetical protein